MWRMCGAPNGWLWHMVRCVGLRKEMHIGIAMFQCERERIQECWSNERKHIAERSMNTKIKYESRDCSGKKLSLKKRAKTNA